MLGETGDFVVKWERRNNTWTVSRCCICLHPMNKTDCPGQYFVSDTKWKDCEDPMDHNFCYVCVICSEQFGLQW